MDCPKCNGTHIKVLETNLCPNGTRRRRYRCLTCEHRWTVWTGERPPKGKRPVRLTADQIRFALTRTDLNNRQVAEVIGCSTELVRQIRAGLVYRMVHPELLRPNAPADAPPPIVSGSSCHECVNWTGASCGFGWTDPLLEGLGFAADCDLYEVSQSMSLA
jgi:transposase-like protein